MSEKDSVRIAVIGAGAMGRNHIRFVTEEPEAEAVAIADAFEGARTTADTAGVPFFTDAAQMMDEVKPEAVIIATPNGLHLMSYDGASSWHKPLKMDVPAVDPALPHKMQLKHFVRVVRGEQAPVVTPADNVKTLRALNAVKRAAETGELVEL